jgi:hypothetical protein
METTSGPSGLFEFSNVPPGRHTLTVRHEGRTLTMPIVVRSGSRTHEYPELAGNTAKSRVSGMVLSEDGVPVADFILTAYSEDGLSIGHGRTKGDGSFELDLSIADGSVIRIETMSDFDTGSLGVCKAGDSVVALRFVPPRVACLDVRSADAHRTLTTPCRSSIPTATHRSSAITRWGESSASAQQERFACISLRVETPGSAYDGREPPTRRRRCSRRPASPSIRECRRRSS